MPLLARFAAALLATVLVACAQLPEPIAPAEANAASLARTAPTRPSTELLPFASPEGLARLGVATARVDFAALANQFEAQYNAAFCGPTSAAIVLNAIDRSSGRLPRDTQRLRPGDDRYVRDPARLVEPRHTQDSVITKGRKTRAQVLGEPTVINGREQRDGGYQLRQLDEMLRANGATTSMTVVADSTDIAEVRTRLIESLGREGDYVIVGYRRRDVGQAGGGHLSPLGAYDMATDSFLVMDVNPASAGWVWMPTPTLVKGMQTFDTVENRGFIVVSP